jgi:hypothetical protein
LRTALVTAGLYAMSVGSPGQNAPLIIAYQAPLCTSSCSSDPYFVSFVNNILPNISGIGVQLNWSSIDSCGSYACTTQSNNCMSPTDYSFCQLDTWLNSYINYNGGAAFAGKKIVLIAEPENDSGGVNSFTPNYVFTSQSWANYAGGCTPPTNCPMQDVSACSNWVGDSGIPLTSCSNSTCPFDGSNGILWNYNACYVTPSAGSGLTCTGSTTDFSGFPVVYEKPIMVGYQQFLTFLAERYNPTSAITNGQTIAPFIAYVRAGLAAGGENNPPCTNVGNPVDSADWPTIATSLPAGYLIQPSNSITNPGGYQYLTDSAGTTGRVTPIWCQTPGCYTQADGTITRWHNVGTKPVTGQSQSNALWTGPQGMAEPRNYADNGYLTTWNFHSGTIGDGTGYVASMVGFLGGLHASFPWTTSAHKGPPGNGNEGYADGEALLAATNAVGFGIQALSIGDPGTYAVGAYPSTTEDWAVNFQKYSNAPVHHLQTAAPGAGGIWWSGYGISWIQVLTSGVPPVSIATVTCTSDCSPFSGQNIYITGNSNVNLNAVWQVACTNYIGAQCATNTLQFVTPGAPAVPDNTYYSGKVWSDNYWPITFPFAASRGASSIELWECDLDYAYHATTFTGPGTCSTVGLLGPDPNYKAAVTNTLSGQPTSTGIHHSRTTSGGVVHF